MAANQEVSASSEDHHAIWMARSLSKINILQDRCVNVEESALLPKEMEVEVLWSRVNTATALLTYLKSKATTLAAAADSGLFEIIVADLQPQLKMEETCRKQGSADETYVTEMLKHVETVTGVMDSLARRAILAESQAAIEKGKVLLTQEEIQRKVGQINNMSIKLEDMEKFALGTTSILGEMRQRVDRSKELRKMSRNSVVSGETLTRSNPMLQVSSASEKHSSHQRSSSKQIIERLFERLVAKTRQLESEKVQKEAEVQKLMEENTRLTALVDKKEAQLLAMNEQCKMMALSSI